MEKKFFFGYYKFASRKWISNFIETMPYSIKYTDVYTYEEANRTLINIYYLLISYKIKIHNKQKNLRDLYKISIFGNKIFVKDNCNKTILGFAFHVI